MRILSLGAGGFIGSHLASHLLARGHTVTGVDIHSDKIGELLEHPGFTFVRQDIRDTGFEVERLVAEADVVIDLIAYANPGLYLRQPLDVFHLNFTENMKIAEACVARGRRLVQFSSCEVYGKTVARAAPGKLIDPEDPALATFREDETDFILGPVSKHRWIYASAKQLLERVLHAYGLEGRLDYTIVRPFNFIGPKIDYLPSDTPGFPRVFPHFMEACLKGTQMKLVDGGRNRRCYTDIEDAAACIGLIVENPGGVCARQIFNVGSPKNEVSIRGLAELMRDLYATKLARPGARLPSIVDVPAREFYGPGYDDSDRRIPDISKARTLLGWEPRYDLRETLERTMRHYLAANGS
ncbi:MAG: bifunctional UDP-4-keto-pentose/UDP-xylose synthase [Deltaproteobacteria bacterium]|nr:bifunctional UDP-4-keto-pentose/UDP-xylose synthase [Deltaproteobacteria bacterium]